MKISRFRLVLLIFWLILAGLIVWLKIVPNGQIKYFVSYPAKINILGGKGFIGHLTPADRVNTKPGEMAEIFGDPVYFSVFTPRTFSEAKITITYQDNLSIETPLIEAGVLVDNIIWRYKLASLENKLLAEKFSNWSRLQNDEVILLQKNNKFSSVDNFFDTLKNNPKTLCDKKEIQNCLALYNITIDNKYNLPVIPEFKILDTPLQGSHQFYFMAKGNQELNFDFDFVDLNLDKKSDPVVVSIYQGEEKVYSEVLEDNFGEEGGAVVRDFKANFSYKTMIQEQSLYKLEIKVSEDIVIKKITKAPSALNIIGRLHPVTTANLPFSVWTDSSFIKITTNNPASRQKIKFGGQNFSLSEPYEQYEFSSNKNGLKEVVLSKDDVILETDGVFSLSSNSFFNPDFKKVDEHFVLNDDLEYVLATYSSPKKISNNLKQATVVLNTKEAYREKGKYSFMISVPGLSLANSGSLKISNIKVEFSGRTLWDKIKEYVN